MFRRYSTPVMSLRSAPGRSSFMTSLCSLWRFCLPSHVNVPSCFQVLARAACTGTTADVLRLASGVSFPEDGICCAGVRPVGERGTASCTFLVDQAR